VSVSSYPPGDKTLALARGRQICLVTPFQGSNPKKLLENSAD